MPLYTVRPWIVSARMVRVETTGQRYYGVEPRDYVTWGAVATYNDGSTRALGSSYDGATGYPRRGGSGRGAAYVACAVALGYNKPSDRECRQIFASPGLTEYERPEGGKARTVPTGRERMRRLGIRPDTKLRPDMSARERYTVAHRHARLRHGAGGMAEHYAARAMVPRFRRIGYANMPDCWGAGIGGYDTFREVRGKRAERRPYVTGGDCALRYAREEGGRAKDSRWNEGYRRSIAHVRSGRMRFGRMDPARMTTYYGDRIADYQDGARTLAGAYIYSR